MLVPFILAAVVAIALSIMTLVNGFREHKESSSSFRMFEQLIYELEQSTKLANELGPSCQLVQNTKLLDMYEGTLRMLENIMVSAKDLDPFNGKIASVRSVLYLAKESRKRLQITKQGFKKALKGQKVDLGDKKLKNLIDIPKGCFFCSRPFEFVSFKIVSVKLEKKPREEYACSICRKQLKQRKKVRVLHFLHEGQPVHWSQMPGYEPKENYYELNNEFPETQKPVLALVYSRKDDNNGNS